MMTLFANKKYSASLFLFTCYTAFACESSKWNVCLKGGVSPSWYTSSNYLKLAGSIDNSIDTRNFAKMNSFSKMFNVPWIVQAEVIGKCSKAIAFVLDGSFMKAGGRSVQNPLINNPGKFFAPTFSSLSIGQLRLGSRAYGFVDKCVNPYVGFNVGLQFRSNVTFITPPVANDTPQFKGTLFNKDIAVAGAIHLGLASLIGKRFSINVHTEMSFASPLKSNNGLLDFIDNSGVRRSLLLVGSTGAFISLPVTIGLAYNF